MQQFLISISFGEFFEMKTLVKLSLVILLAGVCSCAEIGIRDYRGYQVLRANPANEAQYQALVHLYNEGNFDFWAGPSKSRPADIMVDPLRRTFLEEYLRQHGIVFTTFLQDVGGEIARQAQAKVTKEGMHWEDYQLLDTIYEWLDELVSSYPHLVSITTIGQSTEGHDLKVLKISSGPGNKTGFWIDGTIHAREWVSTSTITYIVNELVTKSGDYVDLLDVLDFYILPVINPDGYVYSHTTDRMWRKTRTNYDNSPCYGVDANRNFGFHWGENGSSNDKCSETYRGPAAYSEPEALAMKNYIVAAHETVRWDTYITIHSYSQLWMTPYGYTEDLTDDYAELKRMGDAAAEELESHFGTHYQVGNAASILYFSSGSSRDWAKGEGGFKYVYTLELRDTGEYGFILPKEQIIPTAIETWAGIQIIAKHYV